MIYEVVHLDHKAQDSYNSLFFAYYNDAVRYINRYVQVYKNETVWLYELDEYGNQRLIQVRQGGTNP